MKKQLGFTLVEVMVVVVILALLASVIVPKIINRPDEAKIVKVKQDILNIESALELYRLDNGSYPTNTQGLKALVTKPTEEPIPTNWKDGGYLRRLELDPWGNPYQYQFPGTHVEVDIYSFGPSKSPDDPKSIIGNWEASQQ